MELLAQIKSALVHHLEAQVSKYGENVLIRDGCLNQMSFVRVEGEEGNSNPIGSCTVFPANSVLLGF